MIGKGWVAAGDLVAGDEVYNLDGSTSTIIGSEIEVLDEPVLVYNLEVEDFHSYFVGCVPVLVHNYVDSQLNNEAFVVRGGTCNAGQFVDGTGVSVIPGSNGLLDGISVQSGNGKGIKDLSVKIKNKQIGVTTVGDIRKNGGNVKPSPRDGNPYHCTLSGITAETAEKLFKPTRKNPNI